MLCDTLKVRPRIPVVAKGRHVMSFYLAELPQARPHLQLKGGPMNGTPKADAEYHRGYLWCCPIAILGLPVHNIEML